MHVAGLQTITPEQTSEIEHLIHMMGASFLEEPWQIVYLDALDALDTSDARKREISDETLRYEIAAAVPEGAFLATDDLAASIVAYRASELGGKHWADVKDEPYYIALSDVFTPEEKRVLQEREIGMESASDFSWIVEESNGQDFLHLLLIGVDTEKRGTGAFRRLMDPLFAYADEQGLVCYLECYSDQLESLYAHFGFEVAHVLEDKSLNLVERCMVRQPKKQ